MFTKNDLTRDNIEINFCENYATISLMNRFGRKQSFQAPVQMDRDKCHSELHCIKISTLLTLGHTDSVSMTMI